MPLSSHFDLLAFSILHPSSPSPVIFNQLPLTNFHSLSSCFSQCCFLSLLYHTITAYFHFKHCSLTFLTCFFVWMPLTFHVSATQVPHCCCFFLRLFILFILFSLSDLFWKICASPLCTALFIYFRTLVTTGCVLLLVKRRSVLLHAWLRLLGFSLWNISSLIPQLSRPYFDVHSFPWPQHSKCFFW